MHMVIETIMDVLKYVFILVVITSNCFGQDNPIVTTSHGPVQGLIANDHIRFLGIPYAKAPIGELRFSPPEVPGKWTELKDASKSGASCYQSKQPLLRVHKESVVDSLAMTFSEDCLFINVYLPGTALPDLRDPLAVMVWISGISRDAAVPALLDPVQLSLDGNVIVVTFNHRVGALGSFNQMKVANLHLLDQQVALQWVQDNIASFAGNLNKVTIMGEHEGARSVSLHIVSPKSKGLFSSAISFGSVMAPAWMPTPESAQDHADKLVDAAGCKRNETREIIKCLRAKTADEINGIEVQFPVVVDGTFIPDVPQSLWEESKFHPVDYLVGCNRPDLDLEFTVDPAWFRQDNGLLVENINSQLGRIKQFQGYGNETERGIRQAIRDQYLPDLQDSASNILGYATIIRDVGCTAPIGKLTKLIEATGKQAFVYEFSGAFPNNAPSMVTPGWLLMGGNKDIGMMAEGDRKLYDILVDYVSTFAKLGKPQHYDAASDSTISWPPYNTTGDKSYLRLELPITADNNIQSRPYADAISFWNVLLPALANDGVIQTMTIEDGNDWIFDREIMQWVLVGLAVLCVGLLFGMLGACFMYCDVRRHMKKREDEGDDNEYNNTLEEIR